MPPSPRANPQLSRQDFPGRMTVRGQNCSLGEQRTRTSLLPAPESHTGVCVANNGDDEEEDEEDKEEDED